MTDHRNLILVVEDSDEQFEGLRRAFRKLEVACAIRRVTDGDEALDYLLRRGRHADPASSPRPAVVLLDLNLPGTDGREVLDLVKADESARGVPIVVLSTSSNPADIRRCYRAGAASYIIKPVRFDDLLAAVAHFKRYWFETVALPTE